VRRVKVHAGALMAVFGEHARQQRHAEPVELVGDTLERDGQHARVGEDDLLDVARGRVAGVGGLHVGLHHAADFGQLGQQGGGDPAGVDAGRRNPWRKADFFSTSVVRRSPILANAAIEPGRHIVLGQAVAFEIARKQHMHEIAGQLGHAVLGGQIDAVQMVDAAIRGP